MTFPSFTTGEVLTAADMNAVGLWLVKTQTIGSAVATVDVTSSFSSSYDNYIISFAGTTATNAFSLNLALLSGTTPTTTGWYGTEFYCAIGATAWTGQVSANNGGTVYCSAGTAASGLAAVVEIQAPFLAQHTRLQYQIADSAFFRNGYGYHNANTSYNGFRVSPTSGTLTGGTIRVYGMRN
jgi:hypothetical protein